MNTFNQDSGVDLELSVSDFVAIFNQTLEFAYPSVAIVGELANFKISRNRWVYFDLKDENSMVRFFGTIYKLPGPLEDGMLLKVVGQPRLHNSYGFSVNILKIQPVGEGSLRRAADLLKIKLTAEGLFEESRKRHLTYPPSKIGLISAKQSAAFVDFTKILNDRWRGIDIDYIDVQVQGEGAPNQIVRAIEEFNSQPDLPEILVIVRGGGSAEDLAAFNSEAVTRAVASSRIPTLVAIGHEVDISLAELAADQRASTPTHAAELIAPDKKEVRSELQYQSNHLKQLAKTSLDSSKQDLKLSLSTLESYLSRVVDQATDYITHANNLLEALNPQSVLQRGYAIVRHSGQALRSAKGLKPNDIVNIDLATDSFEAQVKKIE